MTTLNYWALVSVLPGGSSPCKDEVKVISEHPWLFSKLQTSQLSPPPPPPLLLLCLQENKGLSSGQTLQKIPKSNDGTSSHSGGHWPQKVESFVQLGGMGPNGEDPGPKMSNSMSGGSENNNCKYQRWQGAHSEHCWHIIYLSLMCKNNTINCLFIQYERL